MYDLTISIVTYNNKAEQLQLLLGCISKSSLDYRLYLVDNSEDDRLKELTNHYRFSYIHNERNLGFGKAHNIAIKLVLGKSKYHLVLNPDVYFDDGTLDTIFLFMEENQNIGILMPKILYPDGQIQHLPKLLPSPINILLRKITISGKLYRLWNRHYEMLDVPETLSYESPIISGCFSFIRTTAFEKAGLYDERFFMYFEDFDLSRRMGNYFMTIYFSGASAYHLYERGARKSLRLFLVFLMSAIRYFNKWGWCIDPERGRINRKALSATSGK